MQENGFKVDLPPEVAASLVELEHLEKSIGPIGLLALKPFLRVSRKELWQLSLLGKPRTERGGRGQVSRTCGQRIGRGAMNERGSSADAERRPEPPETRGRFRRWTQELSRRHVPRTAALYVAFGWGLTEILTAALDAFGLPSRWGDWAVILFVSAFPLVLALSWAFEVHWGRVERDRRRAPEPMFWWTAGSGLVLSLLVLIPILLRTTPEPPVPVRPFDLAILRGEETGPQAEALLDGLVGDLERSLASRSDLRIYSARAISERVARGTPTGELPVARLIELGVQQSGSAVRLRVSVQRTDSGEVTWSEALDDELDEFFALQDRLLDRLVRQLSLSLDPTSGRPTENLDAYLAFQRARRVADEGGRDKVVQAVELAKEAVALDPAYREAQALLGNLFLDVVNRYPVRYASDTLLGFAGEARRLSETLGDAAPEALRLAVRLETRAHLRRDGRGWHPDDATKPLPRGAALQVLAEDATARSVLLPLAAAARLGVAAGNPITWTAARLDEERRLADGLLADPTDLELALTHAVYSTDPVDRLTGLAEARPDAVSGWQRLGWAHYDRGALNRAAEAWARAYALDPDTLATRTNHLRALLDIGRRDAARALVERHYDETLIEPEFVLLAAANELAAGRVDDSGFLLRLAAERAGEAFGGPCLAAVAALWSGSGEPLAPDFPPCEDAEFARFGDSLQVHAALAMGETDGRQALLAPLEEALDRRLALRPSAADHHLRAAIRATLGDTAGALEDLDEAEASGWRRDWYTRWHPAFRELHGVEEFELLLEGLEARVNRERERRPADGPVPSARLE